MKLQRTHPRGIYKWNPFLGNFNGYLINLTWVIQYSWDNRHRLVPNRHSTLRNLTYSAHSHQKCIMIRMKPKSIMLAAESKLSWERDLQSSSPWARFWGNQDGSSLGYVCMFGLSVVWKSISCFEVFRVFPKIYVSVLFLQNVPIFRDYMYVCGCVRDSVYVYIRINLWDDLRKKQNVLFPCD